MKHGHSRDTAPLGWADESEVTTFTKVPADVLRRGIDAGLFDGLVCVVDGDYWYAPDLLPLIAWSDKLGDDVVAGVLTHAEAKRMLWARARQLRCRTATLNHRLEQAFTSR